ncbi:hypothetical protein JL720_10148 [Aureococcus anophagefferens]|nr:hypothetical protein JL720_10148 [Aureococcus anophagefferens]
MEPGQPDPGAYTPVAVAEAELHKKGEEAHYAALELADAAVAADYGAAAGGELPPDYPDNPDYAPEAYGGGAPPPGAVPPAGYAPPGGEQWTPRSYAMAAAHAEMQQAAIEHHMMESMMAEAMMREHIHAEMERAAATGQDVVLTPRSYEIAMSMHQEQMMDQGVAPMEQMVAPAGATPRLSPRDPAIVSPDMADLPSDVVRLNTDGSFDISHQPLVDFDAVAAPPAPVNGAAADAAADAGAAAPVDDEPVASTTSRSPRTLRRRRRGPLAAGGVAPADSDLQSTAKTLASPGSDASEPAAARFDEPAEPAASDEPPPGGGGARGGGDGPRALRRAAGGGCGDAPAAARGGRGDARRDRRRGPARADGRAPRRRRRGVAMKGATPRRRPGTPKRAASPAAEVVDDDDDDAAPPEPEAAKPAEVDEDYEADFDGHDDDPLPGGEADEPPPMPEREQEPEGRASFGLAARDPEAAAEEATMAAFGENPEEDAAMMAAIGVDPEDRAALIAAANAEIGRGEPEARDEPEEPAAALRWDDAARRAALRWDGASGAPLRHDLGDDAGAPGPGVDAAAARERPKGVERAPQGGSPRRVDRGRGGDEAFKDGDLKESSPTSVTSPLHRERDESPRRARFAAEVSSPKPRKARFGTPPPRDGEASVKVAGGTPPPGGRKARFASPPPADDDDARESPQPDASELHERRRARFDDEPPPRGVQFESGKKKKRKARKSPRFPDDAMATRPAGQSQTPGNPEDPDAAPIVQVQFFAAPEAVEEAAKRKAANRAKRRAQEEAEAKSLRARGRLSVLEARLAALERDAAEKRRRLRPREAAEPRLVARSAVDVEQSASDLSGDDGRRRRGGVGRDDVRDGFLWPSSSRRALHAAGLRSHEIRQLLRSAKLARSALRSSPRKRLPKIRDKNLRSKSAQDQASSAYGRGVKPSIDPTSWAKKRKEQVLSAERRRKIRQTE